ncbi:high mobility group nucleosome-binding domain-containing protein 5-like [Homarus americanus]|uniref:high mobility group nucleosome-binding domain-containing protein 5-like n=1 Tax=Homarus americanus TaxID=6706 RepID=UPI001C46AD84|nr:high mobility group nucleosome-binding domain-containing protein 5-like [Homarus americanus]
MVASYKTGGYAVRLSFVRVPGNGTAKVAAKKSKSLCWDLARSSTVAAAITVEPMDYEEDEVEVSDGDQDGDNKDDSNDEGDDDIEKIDSIKEGMVENVDSSSKEAGGEEEEIDSEDGKEVIDSSNKGDIVSSSEKGGGGEEEEIDSEDGKEVIDSSNIVSSSEKGGGGEEEEIDSEDGKEVIDSSNKGDIVSSSEKDGKEVIDSSNKGSEKDGDKRDIDSSRKEETIIDSDIEEVKLEDSSVGVNNVRICRKRRFVSGRGGGGGRSNDENGKGNNNESRTTVFERKAVKEEQLSGNGEDGILRRNKRTLISS